MSEESLFKPHQRHQVHANGEVFSFETRPDGTCERVPIEEFDYEAVFKRLDGDRNLVAEARRLASVALSRLLDHIARDHNGNLRDDQSISRQLVSVLYASGLITETLEALGERYGISKQGFGKRAKEARSRIGVIKPRSFSSGAMKAFRAAQSGEKHWRRRQAKEQKTGDAQA